MQYLIHLISNSTSQIPSLGSLTYLSGQIFGAYVYQIQGSISAQWSCYILLGKGYIRYLPPSFYHKNIMFSALTWYDAHSSGWWAWTTTLSKHRFAGLCSPGDTPHECLVQNPSHATYSIYLFSKIQTLHDCKNKQTSKRLTKNKPRKNHSHTLKYTKCQTYNVTVTVTSFLCDVKAIIVDLLLFYFRFPSGFCIKYLGPTIVFSTTYATYT